jgi:hypothetical protein
MQHLYGTEKYTSFISTLDAEIKQRQDLIEKVKELFPTSTAYAKTPRKVRTVRTTTTGRKPLSKAARLRIAEAQRKRWAAQKKADKKAAK